MVSSDRVEGASRRWVEEEDPGREGRVLGEASERRLGSQRPPCGMDIHQQAASAVLTRRTIRCKTRHAENGGVYEVRLYR
jgi:hypothetical protein